ncbi:secretory carrier 3, Secretory carrier membrane protein 1 [Hibiscus trionum]|uniref:Secretory carrier-associated membrane protein n=1 Tax=Hibiscus trionum TaxID=183268 RepID=A0A9W7IVI8_HIBTR|nr:secretory carrier 3, Secretory carrier membrane protein 1 [Hibiscus trionum]
MSQHDTNPFAEEEVNPFADPSDKKGTGGGGGSFFSTSRLSPLPPEPFEPGATIDIPLDTHSTQDVKAKERELQAKEAELKRREEELRKREEAIKKAGIVIEVKNWPAFFPIIHNDIANEIPIHLQTIMYTAFSTLIGLAICLLYNMVTVTAAWSKGQGPIIWLLAVIYILTGIPGGFYLWYRPLYNAARNDSALRFGWFLLAYSIHIAFCVLAAVAPEFVFKEGSITGILAALSIFLYDRALGIMYFVGFGLFCCETLASIWVIQQVYMYFRGSGKAAEMKREVARQTMMAL